MSNTRNEKNIITLWNKNIIDRKMTDFVKNTFNIMKKMNTCTGFELARMARNSGIIMSM